MTHKNFSEVRELLNQSDSFCRLTIRAMVHAEEVYIAKLINGAMHKVSCSISEFLDLAVNDDSYVIVEVV